MTTAVGSEAGGPIPLCCLLCCAVIIKQSACVGMLSKDGCIQIKPQGWTCSGISLWWWLHGLVNRFKITGLRIVENGDTDVMRIMSELKNPRKD